MPRNGSGTSTVANTFSPGSTISSANVNANFADVASQLTNSLPRDGQAAMTAAFKIVAGTVGSPGLAFSTDTDTGFYRIGANNMGLSIGGTKTLDVSASTFAISQGDLNCVSGKVQEAGNSLLPPGVVLEYGGSSAPSGFLLCDGSAVNRTTYADLFTAISTTYGSGDGSETFNVPDRTGRVGVGKEASATRMTSAGGGVDGGTLGATGGGETHTLTLAESPAHDHDYNDPGHTHTDSTVGGSGSKAPSGGDHNVDATNTTSGSSTTGITHNSAGGDGAHANVQPTIVMNYIIKT